MALARVQQISVSLDGFATGEGQSHEAAFGHAGDGCTSGRSPPGRGTNGRPAAVPHIRVRPS